MKSIEAAYVRLGFWPRLPDAQRGALHMRVLIVGGVAGGASMAARLRWLSEGASISIFERSGHWVNATRRNFALC